MGLKNVEVIEQQEVHAKSWFQRFRSKMNSKYAAVGAVATTATMLSVPTHAEGVLATILAGVSDEVQGVIDSQKSLYGLLVVVIAMILGWAYFKRAAR